MPWTCRLAAEHQGVGVVMQTTDGQYALSTRCMADLDQYITEALEDAVATCSLCKKLCLVVRISLPAYINIYLT